MKVYDLVIIGSGPAGLAAAIYAQRARLDTLVIEKEMMSGGQVLNTYDVDNYPGLPGIGGFDLGMKLRAHADQLEAVFTQDEVKSIELVQNIRDNKQENIQESLQKNIQENPQEEKKLWEEASLQAAELHSAGAQETDDREKEDLSGDFMWKKVIGGKDTYLAKTVIVASGATHRRLGVPGEEKLAGMGVSYCATCDGAFFRNRATAVIGGGDVAIEDAIFLARMCRQVYVIHRRDELRGAKALQEKLFSLDNVTVIWDTVAERINGEESVSGLSLKNVKTGEQTELPVDGVFIAVGITPNSQPYEGLLDMEHGYIRADENGTTSVAGIYAAGDIRTKQLRQIVTAAADGANAVTSAERYLTEY